MAEEIINRVANSKLEVINLEDYYPEGERILFDIKDWLYEGFFLKEKEFRQHIATHNWAQYQNTYVALNCSSDAIIPAWAFMLIAIQLEPFVKKSVVGSLDTLETSIYQGIISKLDFSKFSNLPVIIKGCSEKPVPENAYILLSQALRPIAKSIMYGEACSSVPLFKKK